MPNIYLVGMMGSGKTVTGRKLAAMMSLGFVDLDACVEKKTGRSIADIFETDGEDFFRGLECAVLEEQSAGAPRVIATGGGVILRPENVERMRRTGKVVYLETGIDALWQRVRGRSERPLLKAADPRDRLVRILETRRPVYEKVSDLSVVTDGRTAEDVAAEIFRYLEKKT